MRRKGRRERESIHACVIYTRDRIPKIHRNTLSRILITPRSDKSWRVRNNFSAAEKKARPFQYRIVITGHNKKCLSADTRTHTHAYRWPSKLNSLVSVQQMYFRAHATLLFAK